MATKRPRTTPPKPKPPSGAYTPEAIAGRAARLQKTPSATTPMKKLIDEANKGLQQDG